MGDLIRLPYPDQFPGIVYLLSGHNNIWVSYPEVISLHLRLVLKIPIRERVVSVSRVKGESAQCEPSERKKKQQQAAVMDGLLSIKTSKRLRDREREREREGESQKRWYCNYSRQTYD